MTRCLQARGAEGQAGGVGRAQRHRDLHQRGDGHPEHPSSSGVPRRYVQELCGSSRSHKCVSGNLYNDIAIVKLAGAVDLATNPHISPVCLPDGFQVMKSRRPSQICFLQLNIIRTSPTISAGSVDGVRTNMDWQDLTRMFSRYKVFHQFKLTVI